MMDKTCAMDRREFLRRTGGNAALVGIGVGFAARAMGQERPAVTPADPHQPKTGRLLKDHEPIGLAVIGVGGQGNSHFQDHCKSEHEGANTRMRAVCDVFQKRLDHRQRWAERMLERKVDTYMDYRKVLERDDVDGVVIATPDHWHASISIDAMRAGKDVYCEKPMTLTIEEAIAVRDVVLETGRIYQCGAQGCSDDMWWKIRDFIRQGGIGKVLWAQADCSRNSAGGPDDRGGEWNWPIDEDATDDPNAGENYINWDLWLGSAPKRPFSKPRFFQFRKYWDYSGGIATDLHYHVLAPLTIALSAEAPERAVGSGGIFVQHDDREVPDTFVVTLDYPGDFTIVLTSSMANRQGNPTVIRGHRATIRSCDGGFKVTAEKEFEEWFKNQHGATEIVVNSEPRADHRACWLNAIRSRENVALDAETAYRAMAGVKMGVDSYRQDKVIFWDHKKEGYT
ncbi:MAG TPA: Gfo/Idh/MocA family oxidoreductase, partial [Candidatus Hydrogenedentes bacterium]|nr:Gfo/Idh/MocA family oxidoreductase [Candidatus Hydrogenedentota bacterium]